ncbi:DUF4261 domain-containing protein [uncultured Draconibacterium sp.]|uniref:DUF4261 domain-containing protein n=1 Tax=uncultured Draconibacterium sp. TaxID=1573823 RepID=UPI0032162390
MKKTSAIALIGIIFMGLFSFLRKGGKVETTPISAILGMVLLEEPNSMEIKNVIAELRNKWELYVDDTESDNETSVLVINDYKIAIGNMPMPIPGDEIKDNAEYNYFWKNGVEEAPKHKGHIILSLMNGGKNPVQENILYSKVASSILNNSKSIGIYIGGRSLVLKKEFYNSNVEIMTENDLPLYNWIYFGLRTRNEKQSVYTYGLSDFGKSEMEIIDSEHSLEELNSIMFDLAHYVIANNVILKHGETIGVSAEQKLKITESKGVYLDGKTLKIEY